MAGFPLIRLVVRVRCPGVRSHRAGPEPQRGRDAAEPRQPGVPALLPTAAPRGKAKRPRRALLTRASRSPERWLWDTSPRPHGRAHSPRSSLDAFPLYWGTSDPGPNRLRSRWATPPDGMAGFAVTFLRGDWGSVFPLGSSFSGEALTGDRGIRPSLWPKADVSTQLGRTTLVANR